MTKKLLQPFGLFAITNIAIRRIKGSEGSNSARSRHTIP